MRYSKPKICRTTSRGREDWYVYVSYTENKRSYKVKKRFGINRLKSHKEKAEEARIMADSWAQLIKEGKWSHDNSKQQQPLKTVMEDMLETKKPPNTNFETYSKYKNRLKHF